MKIISLAEVDKLPTPRLLAYYKKIPRRRVDWCDYPGECKECQYCCPAPFKNINERETYRADVRDILNTRENIK